jgi:hypothetical protein
MPDSGNYASTFRKSLLFSRIFALSILLYVKRDHHIFHGRGQQVLATAQTGS